MCNFLRDAKHERNLPVFRGSCALRSEVHMSYINMLIDDVTSSGRLLSFGLQPRPI
jgi:hypothetical protein